MKWVVGLGVITVCLWATYFLNFGDNIVYFYTPQEAIAKNTASTIKVGGLVKAGTLTKKDDGTILFKVTDNTVDIDVIYKGLPPDMFKENQGVVVEGRFHKEVLIATSLMVKHSEEYKKPGDHSTMNKMLLEKSMFKEL